MASEVLVDVVGYPDSDAEERAELAWDVEAELRAREIAEISRTSLPAPERAKGTAMEWAQLVVALAGSLPPLIAALQHWVGRHPGASITLEVDGDRLTLTDPSSDDRRELIENWLRRHAAE